MLKHTLWLILFSILVILAAPYLLKGIGLLLMGHGQILGLLGKVFSGGFAAQLIQKSLALLLIPAIVGVVLGVGYWSIKRSRMPGIMCLVWAVWLIMTVAIIMNGHHAG